MHQRWLLGEVSILKALSALLLLETTGSVHLISFPPEVSCNTKICRGSTVLSKGAYFSSFMIFDLFLKQISRSSPAATSCFTSQGRHRASKLYCFWIRASQQVCTRSAPNAPQSLSGVQSLRANKMSPAATSSSTRSCVRCGHGDLGREYFAPQICLRSSMLREPDMA